MCNEMSRTSPENDRMENAITATLMLQLSTLPDIEDKMTTH